MFSEELQRFDHEHIWHPYTSMTEPLPVFPVESASGCRIRLTDGRELIDGMASWWCVIHGYNHPVLNAAIEGQLKKTAHVMFGGFTHEPAVRLAQRLVEITPNPLQHVFFADSGSVSVEVAIKMAVQFWQTQGKPAKSRLMTIRRGYHGDTLGAMSVCDPVTGMHSLFAGILPRQVFVEEPQCEYKAEWDESFIAGFRDTITRHKDELAAVILEPVVQGVGGMRFYSPHYLRRVRELCDQYDVLLIADEIATGFGRSGKLFGCEHAGVSPDIMCVGKALTGGYMTLAAVLATSRVAHGVSENGGVFMHGPTFMANPLACSVALASVGLLLGSRWEERISAIESALRSGLEPCREMSGVVDVRVLGAIGVVETQHPIIVKAFQKEFVERGVWVRPFGRVIYVMPPYVMTEEELNTLSGAIVEVVATANGNESRFYQPQAT